MYNDIEKSDLTIVKDDISCQPNVIRLKPSSKAAILRNELSVTVSNKNLNKVQESVVVSESEKKVVSEESKVEEGQTVAGDNQQLGETRTANLFRMSEDTVKQESKAKPINLNPNMISTMFKKCDSMIDALQVAPENAENTEIVNEETIDDEVELNNIFAAIDSVAEENDVKVDSKESTSDYDINVETEKVSDDGLFNSVDADKNVLAKETELIQASNTLSTFSTSDFVNLIQTADHYKHDVEVSQERLENTTFELEKAKASLQEEIVKNYDLEKAIQEAKQMQFDTLSREAEKANERILEFQHEKAALEMENEKKASELENTNTDLIGMQQKNADLLDIYNAIMDSSSVEKENVKVA